MNTIHLEYFVEVVKQHSINKAAQNLNISRTSVMSAISSLEKEIGFPLLIRTNKGTEVTAEGTVIYNDSLNILDITKSWSQIKQDANIATEITLCTVPAIGLTYGIDIIQKFNNIYENYKFQNISILNSVDDTVRALKYKNPIIIGAYFKNQLNDLAFVVEAKDCIQHELFTASGNFYCNNQHSFLRNQPITIDTLKDAKIILSPLMNDSGIVSVLYPQNVTYVDTLSQIMTMLSKDKRYISCFSSLLRMYPHTIPDNIVKLDVIPKVLEKLTYFLIYPRKLYQTPKIKKFIDFVLNYDYLDCL